MSIRFIFILFLLIVIQKSHGQDSIHLVFKNKVYIKPRDTSTIFILSNNDYFIEKVVPLGNSKFFYIKQRLIDSFTIESGQLGWYNIDNRPFLLREGVWVLENKSTKIFFSNLGNHGMIDEIKVKLEPQQYGGFSKAKRKIRSASTSHK